MTAKPPTDKKIEIKKSDLPAYKVAARRMRPRLPIGTTKQDLRDMLAQAMANTARKSHV
jgi:hypothetical protein